MLKSPAADSGDLPRSLPGGARPCATEPCASEPCASEPRAAGSFGGRIRGAAR
ncbi:hypothetical protein U717_14130 [Rhodobacter capsulatus R121]|nr:hypothetical protein U714_13965 [Rhodobacter capsulatus DE442]ETD75451.1 hypothetical protein U717_14130 [Rhodobacter capsulatus R121]ETE52984.1 hypothetical protein U715_14125 [Rhodobacter capsulatus Y262]